jgi:inner membrane transporter RhtA
VSTLEQVDRGNRSWRGIAMLAVSALSNQVGAAVGARAFDAIGPVGVVAVRQWVAAVVLMPVARPPLRRLTWSQWWPVLLLAVVFGCMNLGLYTAIDRLGLALAVTLEFLGPLAVALAGSRSRRDLLTAAGAAAGVYVLVLPGASSDYVGIAIGTLAGACWAAYILLNRVAGARLPGLQAPAVASALCAVAYLPVLLLLLGQTHTAGLPLVAAVTAGLLSSVVPYAVDLVALRFVPAHFFGVVMSIHPVLAALVGLVLLGQYLVPHEWIGIAVVVLANAAAVAGTRSGGGEGSLGAPLDRAHPGRADRRGARCRWRDGVHRLGRTDPRVGAQDVRPGAVVDLVGIGRGGPAQRGGQGLRARRVLRVGQPQVREVLPGGVPQSVDAATDAGGDPAVDLVAPPQQLAGVPDARVVDLHRLRAPGEAVHRRVPRHEE